MAGTGPNLEENLDDREVHELEEILHTKIYPGTEIMRDVGSHHFVKAERRVLIPQPSDDPRDPLNWSPFWKGATIFSATAISFSLNFGPLALAPMFEEYTKEWDRSLADVVQFTGVAILCLGFSNFIWVPIMVCFGRRPVAIFSTLICVCSSIWRARATSYDSFMGASVLNGIAAGPCETLMPQVIADIIFLHERGFYQTLYFSMYFISLMIGPIISGPMAEHTGWRSFWWFNTALLLFTLLVNVFLFPETRYNRVLSPHSEKLTTGAHTNAQNASTVSASRLQEAESGMHPQTTHVDPALGKGKPSKLQFAPFQKYAGNFLRELWLPLYLHAYPIVEFAAFVVSWSASGYLQVNLSQTQAFAAPPYNFTSQTIGFFSFSLFIGGLIGLFTCGPLSDWVAAKLTERNGGVREPEMRLVAMVPYMLIMILGSIVTAVGYDYHWPWQAIVIIGYGSLGMQVSALPSIASTYAIDSYKPVTGSMFVMITINKNVWGYGMSKFLTNWAEADGFIPPILVNMALTTVFCLCGILFWYYGKHLRGITAKSFVHRL
ncbi:MFS transporter [Thozetella sp. PMI_491]|nr:MFS transporter [Thozetella sp. PMI_491]